MDWFGDVYSSMYCTVFTGTSGENTCHTSPIPIIAIGHDGASIVRNKDCVLVGGAITLIRPLTPHTIVPGRPVTFVFLDPVLERCPRFWERLQADPFVNLDSSTIAIDGTENAHCIGEYFDDLRRSQEMVIDHRVLRAIETISADPEKNSVASTAKSLGLSPSRLRAITKQAISIPLSKWAVWQKAELASKHMVGGECLSQSAVMGGFSDQAHFTKSLRQMIGVKPSSIAR